MKTNVGFKVSAVTAIRVPATFALPTVDATLKDFARHPGSASLALNVRELQLPLEATVRVPIQTHVRGAGSLHDWDIEIRSASKAPMYPSFKGILSVAQAGANGCELRLEGEYIVPFGELGRTIDCTFLRGAARSTLQHFVHDIAARVMADRMRWAQLA